MKWPTLLVGASLAALSVAQRPTNTSICDYYTTALLGDNNVTTQAIVLTLVVNTAIIGNYTQPNVNLSVPGILKPGKFNGEDVNLLPYFSGALSSTNPPGSQASKGVPVNWLDGGGAQPLTMNQLGSDGSHQATLMIHLYTYFAALLGCSEFGKTADTKYEGDPSMYNVHKFMALSSAEVGYFIEQVGLSAASFGVAAADVKAVGDALMNAFGYRCAPKTAVVAGSDAELQSICIEDDCPLAKNAACDGYAMVVLPTYANGTAYGANASSAARGGPNGTVSSTGAPKSTSSHAANSTKNAAAEIAAVNLGLVGLMGLGVALI